MVNPPARWIYVNWCCVCIYLCFWWSSLIQHAMCTHHSSKCRTLPHLKVLFFYCLLLSFDLLELVHSITKPSVTSQWISISRHQNSSRQYCFHSIHISLASLLLFVPVSSISLLYGSLDNVFRERTVAHYCPVRMTGLVITPIRHWTQCLIGEQCERRCSLV